LIEIKEALLILGKWKEESSRLKVLGNFPSGRLFLNDCRISELSKEAVGLLLPGDRNACEVFLRGLCFEYGEPPHGEETDSIAALIAIGSGVRIVFGELQK
jgi:hypothetical protein